MEKRRIEAEKLPIDEIIEVVFKELTEKEKEIASQFPLSQKDLKILCCTKKLAVVGSWANLLKGIEKRILSREPELKDSKKLQIKVYKWYKNHPRPSKKYFEKTWQSLKEDKENHWRETKINNLISLGIHPSFLASSFEKYGSFDNAIKIVKALDSKYESSNSNNSNSHTESDVESDLSQITVINTPNTLVNTEDLLGPEEENYNLINEIELAFCSEEVCVAQTPCYDHFNMIGSMITSTQNDNSQL